MLAHGIDLKLGWLLVSHSLTLCSLLRACISYRQVKFWVESFVGGLVSLIAPLGFLSGYRRWLLQVPYPHSWAFCLRTDTLSPGCLPHPSQNMTNLFPFLIGTQTCSLGPSFSFTFIGSVGIYHGYSLLLWLIYLSMSTCYACSSGSRLLRIFSNSIQFPAKSKMDGLIFNS